MTRRNYTVDLDKLSEVAAFGIRPRLITIGGSLNLHPHPVAAIRSIADEVGALVLYDAAHVAGLIAGGMWQHPLEEGAHLMSMSTYKSLAGPPGGIVATNDPVLAERIERVVYPGLTANFDVARLAALAVALADIRAHGGAYARAMAAAAHALALALSTRGISVFGDREGGFTESHQFAIEAPRYGGGHTASQRLRKANLLTSGIGLPIPRLAGNSNGIRLGTSELVRIGMTTPDMDYVGELVAEALTGGDLAAIARRTKTVRSRFTGVHFIQANG